jgi:GNAT superfamily N-acetyltransferase
MSVTIRPLDKPGDLGWVVMAHGELYATELGWGTDFEALVCRIVADYASGPDPSREAAWIAETDGRRVGCVFCVRKDDQTAHLRVLLVDPLTRGEGVGRRLVAECVEFARRAGYERMMLWTNKPLVVAGRIYRETGFRLTGEETHRSFGVDLVGQTYELSLTRCARTLP